MAERTSSVRFALTLTSACFALGCDEKPKPEPAQSTTATTEAAPTPPPKPTLPPTLNVDAAGATVAGTHVSLEARDAAEQLKSALAPHATFLDGKDVRLSVERRAKPEHVAVMLRALGAAGATRILVRSSTRTDYPQEVGFVALERAKQAPACSVVAMITEDRGTAVWSLAGGTAGKRGKGMAGPDLTLAGETIAQRAKRCPESQLLFVAGAPGVEFGLVFDLAASTKTLPKAYFSEVALVGTAAVPGHAVTLAP
jgi:hypothetical protein